MPTIAPNIRRSTLVRCGLALLLAALALGFATRPAHADPNALTGILSAGGSHTCALAPDGSVTCWGAIDGTEPGPFTQVSSGGFHTCALTPTGAVDCWGSNGDGQAEDQPGPYDQITSGRLHTCALTPAGAVDCWGYNDHGQAVDQTGPYTQVSAGVGYTCALTPTGGIECWGLNDDGESDDKPGPYTQVGVGTYHTCGLTPTGGVECWGYDASGQAEDQTGPYTQLSVGNHFNCALTPTGAVDCWGLNDEGQATDQPGPYTVVSAAKSAYTCALTPTGAVDCWGLDVAGRTTDQPGPFGPYVPPVSYCPVDDNVGNLLTEVLGTGQGSTTKGYRTRKLVIPNSDEVVALYGQLAAVDVGVMKYVRFRYPDGTYEQIFAPTSPAYRPHAVDWWGTDLDVGANFIKGQFFWGLKGARSPRAFVLWPTYATDEQYANVFTTFDESSENHVAMEPGWIHSQLQTVAIPETQASGANVTIKVALVDVNQDGRVVVLRVSAGSESEERIITLPNSKALLNLETFNLTGVEAGVDEVVIELITVAVSFDFPDGGDSAAIIGAAVSYACGGVPEPTEPPVAKNDYYTFDRYGGTDGLLFLSNGSGADELGDPAATLTSFGGGSLGGTVIDHAAGASIAFAGGTLTVNADGTWNLTGATLDIGVFTFQYRLTNSAGISDATVTLDIYELCLLGDVDAPDC